MCCSSGCFPGSLVPCGPHGTLALPNVCQSLDVCPSSQALDCVERQLCLASSLIMPGCTDNACFEDARWCCNLEPASGYTAVPGMVELLLIRCFLLLHAVHKTLNVLGSPSFTSCVSCDVSTCYTTTQLTQRPRGCLLQRYAYLLLDTCCANLLKVPVHTKARHPSTSVCLGVRTIPALRV
jgi:hypothetical protein